MVPALLVGGAALLAAGCHVPNNLQSPAAGFVGEAAQAPASPPPACSTALKLQAPLLQLPRTDVPKQPARDAVDISQIHTVNRPLQEIGVWNNAGDGWSVLTLQLGSEKARSLAVRLHAVRLPKNGALWLCSIDGKQHAGPYAEAPNGDLWSAALAGAQARIEVWAPTAHRDDFSGLLSDVYGSYR
ncbi:MAG: hypothetical protein ACREVL_00260 [Solimonas sp.]